MPQRQSTQVSLHQQFAARQAIAQTFKNRMIPCEQLLQKRLNDFKQFLLGNPDAASKTKAFSQLQPFIDQLQQGIVELKSPKLQEALGIDRAKQVRINYYSLIAEAYSTNQDYLTARRLLGDIPPEDQALEILLNRAAVEGRAGDATAASLAYKALIEQSTYPSNTEKAQLCLPYLKESASTLLHVSLSNPHLNIGLDFFLNHVKLLELPDIALAVNHSHALPELQAKWRMKLFETLTENPSIDDVSEFAPFYHQHAEYLCRKDDFLSCFLHIRKNISHFPSAMRAYYAFTLMMKESLASERTQTILNQWLVDAALTGDHTAIHHYFQSIFCNRKITQVQQTFDIIKTALTSKDAKNQADAYFIQGGIYDGEFGSIGQQDKKQALISYQAAAALGQADACINLATMYANGEGTSIDEGLAFTYYEKAHNLGNYEAACFFAELYLQSDQTDLKGDKSQNLVKVLRLLDESAVMSKGVENIAQIRQLYTHLSSKMAYYKARCLFSLGQLMGSNPQQSIIQDKAEAFTGLSGYGFPEMHELMNYALTHGTDSIKISAAAFIGECYLYGILVEPDDGRALAYYKQALTVSENIDDYPKFEKDASLRCVFILQELISKETNILAKRALQSEALAYSQRAMNILGDQCSQEELSLANPLMASCYTSTAISDEPLFSQTKPTARFMIDDKVLSKKALQQLQAKLHDPEFSPSVNTLRELSVLVIDANNLLLTKPEILPRLEELVSTCVAEKKTWDPKTMVTVLQEVGKWQLSAATEALKPIFLHMSLLFDLGFSEQIVVLKSLSQCNFSCDVQRDHILPFLKVISARVLKPAAGQLSIAEAARLFHVLAMFDANQTDEAYDETYVELAKLVFTGLKSKDKLAEARIQDISQIYHACHYFRLRYPDRAQWQLGSALRAWVQLYQPSLLTDRAGKISQTQAKIYELIKEFEPNARQEVFIPEAGRQVDVVARHLIIQYNGDKAHQVSNNQGGFAYHSLKENLCYATLKLVAKRNGQKVVRILRDEWAAIDNNKQAQRAYLQHRLPDLLNPAASNTVSGEEIKQPNFFPRPKSESKESPRATGLMLGT